MLYVHASLAGLIVAHRETSASMGRVGEGLSSYYKAKIEELEIQARDKQLNLRRLEAQRNELNTKGDARRKVVAFISERPGRDMIVFPSTSSSLPICLQ